MNTANQAYKNASNSPAGRQASASVKEARDTGRHVGDDVSDFASDAAKKAGDFASDMSRQAGRQFVRARHAASDVYDEAHELGVQNPHITLGLAAALGFLLGAYLVSRR
jgi:ElaB/YqjD/DUF883 family membrane-anchored ribosome-binding protein